MDKVQETVRAGIDLRSRNNPMDRESFRKALANRQTRIERAVGILKDHLDTAVVGAPFGAGQGEHILALEGQRTAVGLVEPHEASGEGRFPASRLTYDAERLAAPDLEAHAIKSPEHPPGTSLKGVLQSSREGEGFF
jgi:hypothetical protein